MKPDALRDGLAKPAFRAASAHRSSAAFGPEVMSDDDNKPSGADAPMGICLRAPASQRFTTFARSSFASLMRHGEDVAVSNGGGCFRAETARSLAGRGRVSVLEAAVDGWSVVAVEMAYFRTCDY